MTYIINMPCKKCDGVGGKLKYDPSIKLESWEGCKKCDDRRFYKKTFKTKAEILSMAEKLLINSQWDIYSIVSHCDALRQDALITTVKALLDCFNKGKAERLWAKYCPYPY